VFREDIFYQIVKRSKFKTMKKFLYLTENTRNITTVAQKIAKRNKYANFISKS